MNRLDIFEHILCTIEISIWYVTYLYKFSHSTLRYVPSSDYDQSHWALQVRQLEE